MFGELERNDSFFQAHGGQGKIIRPPEVFSIGLKNKTRVLFLFGGVKGRAHNISNGFWLGQASREGRTPQGGGVLGKLQDQPGVCAGAAAPAECRRSAT